MATVPVSNRPRESKIDESFLMMAAAQMSQEAPVPTMNEEEMAANAANQEVIKGFKDPNVGAARKQSKEYMDQKLMEEDLLTDKKVDRPIEPGERAIDRERGLFSKRVVRRI